ncbi:predicted protein, partial [Nematostella vectensis]
MEAQQELRSLQRQYRTIVNNRQVLFYEEETKNTIRKQVAAIETLEAERVELEDLMRVAGRMRNQCIDQANLDEIKQLLDREQKLQAEMQEERERKARVDEQVQNMQEQIANHRNKMKGSTGISQETTIRTQNKIRLLTNRMDIFRKKFNDAMTYNRNLREKMSQIQNQKQRFEDLSKRLDNTLKAMKDEIDMLSESATGHYHARDEAQHRMASIRERKERELAMYNLEIKDMIRVIEHDSKLREFMATKSVDRVYALEQEQMSRDLRKLSALLNGLKLEVDSYEDVFAQIKEATGIHDTDTLVQSFIDNEDTNFALFNYVNELTSEIEPLEDEIKFLRDEIDQASFDIRREGVENDVRRQEIQRELEEKLAAVSFRHHNALLECKKDRRTLEMLKACVERVFAAVGCDRSVIDNMLGTGAGVDDNSIMMHMGIIEQKCNQLLQLHAWKGLKRLAQSQPAVVHTLQGQGPDPPQPMLSIMPPTIEEEDYQDASTNDERPLTMEDARKMVV